EEIERLLPGEIAVFREGRLERRLRPDPSRTAAPRPGDALVRSLEHAVKDHLDGGAPPAVLFGLDQGSVVLTETLARIARGPVRSYTAVLEGGGSTIRAAAERFGARHE